VSFVIMPLESLTSLCYSKVASQLRLNDTRVRNNTDNDSVADHAAPVALQFVEEAIHIRDPTAQQFLASVALDNHDVNQRNLSDSSTINKAIAAKKNRRASNAVLLPTLMSSVLIYSLRTVVPRDRNTRQVPCN
jgi:hypothetical protein